MVEMAEHFRFIERKILGLTLIGPAIKIIRRELVALTEQSGVARHVEQALSERQPPSISLIVTVSDKNWMPSVNS